MGKTLFFAVVMLLLLLSKETQAQTSISQNLVLSYTGLHISTTLQVRRGNFGLYAGPKVLLSKSALVVKGPWGVDAGVNYYFPSQGHKLLSFVNANYLNTFSTSRERIDGYRPRGFIQEYGIGYGVQWNAGKRISLVNQIGVGRYTEFHHLSGSQSAYRYSGFNTLIRLGLTFRLNK